MRPLPDYISIFFCLAELSGYYVCGVTQSLKALTISRTSSLDELLSPSREYIPIKTAVTMPQKAVSRIISGH